MSKEEEKKIDEKNKKIVDKKNDELDEKNLDEVSGGAGPGNSGMKKPGPNSHAE